MLRLILRGELAFDRVFSMFKREIHPDGLPPSYTIILLFRLLPDTPSEPFDLWQIADKNNNPEVGVTMNRKFLSSALEEVKYLNLLSFSDNI